MGSCIPFSVFFFFSSRRRHTRCSRDWSSDVCSSDLLQGHGRRKADLDLRDGAEEHREADDRNGARQGGRQPVARLPDAGRHPQYAPQEDAAAADQRVVTKVSRALLSVSDKSGIVEFARALAALGVQILSTGGTAKLLEKEGIAVTEVSAYTGFPEMLDGRVKTLHPKIHAGLLARRDDPGHLAALRGAGIPPIDLLVVNLYPFQATVADPDCSFEEAIENIDIGGPALLRAAAKNHAGVGVVVDPADYARVLEEMRSSGGISEATRFALAKKVFAHTAAYDGAIANYLSSLAAAYEKAFKTDPVSAFGGILAFNRALDRAAAEAASQQFAEVIVAPRVEPDAQEVFAKKANVRVLEVPLSHDVQAHDYKRVGGGLLVQSSDSRTVQRNEMRVVTKAKPTESQWSDLLFAWRVAKFVKSNAIVFCRDGMTLGVGAGQMSRVDSSRLAAMKAQAAKLSLAGSVVASDAFFPFRDGLDVVAEAGAAALIQPGGSVRDDEVIAAADERGVAMVLTGVRHLRH